MLPKLEIRNLHRAALFVLLVGATAATPFVRSAFGGEFRVSALPSGDYFVAAVSRLQGSRDGGDWQNPDVLLQLEARAERITVSEGQTANVSLRLIDR